MKAPNPRINSPWFENKANVKTIKSPTRTSAETITWAGKNYFTRKRARQNKRWEDNVKEW